MTPTRLGQGGTAAISWLVATVLVLTGCGLGADREPRALPVTTTTTSTVPESTGTEPFAIYVVQAERLVPVTRQLPTRTPFAVMESLLKPPTSSDGPGLSSSIPAATELLGLSTEQGTLSVDLSEDFRAVQGPARQQAIGQIVLSQTQMPGVERLTFSIDGEPLEVTSEIPERGDVNVVNACDYQGLLAEPGGESTDLSTAQLTLLGLRREDLRQQCGQL